MKRVLLRWILFLSAACLLAGGVYFLPPVHQRLSWRLANLRTEIFYRIHPPDRVEFSVEQESQAVVQRTLAAIQSVQAARMSAPVSLPASIAAAATGFPPTAASETASPDVFFGTPAPTELPSPTPIPTITTVPLPPKVTLNGIRYEWQTFNNCGPTNLAMALSFWGWQGDQRTVQAAIRPNPVDANVMPDEMVAYANATGLVRAALRYGGDLNLLKRLLAAGFPVLIETGHQPVNDWWLGHYVLVSGYDDGAGQLITQDSLIMQNLSVTYEDIQAHGWRDFNNLYIVLYPPKRESEVLALLGPDTDPVLNRRRALQKAVDEAPGLSGRDLFFDFYNQGDNLLALGDVKGAAQAYDTAFTLYKDITDKSRPWRVMWYRAGTYEAYYNAGRPADVIGLANAVLSNLSKRNLEESHYWRGLSYEAIGDSQKALEDYQIAVMLRPTYDLAQAGIKRLSK